MLSYSHLMRAYEVADYRAFATSAMREATNGNEIVKQIKEIAGIELEIIDGKKEAEIIFQI